MTLVRQAPIIDAPVTLQFQGDWGLANFHRILCWLCHVFAERAPGSRIAIWNGSGGFDNIDAVSDGTVQLAIVTPACFLEHAIDGDGLFAGRPSPRLRALATMPQDDAMLLAVAGSCGVGSLADLHRLKPALVIAVPPDDGVSLVGLAAHRLLASCGLDRGTVGSWGGGYVETAVRPGDCLSLVIEGKANAIVHEAIMVERWQQAVIARDLRFISIDGAAMTQLTAMRWREKTIASGHFPGQANPLTAMEFSDFVVIVRDDLPADVARLLTWCLVETRDLIEGQYRHIPRNRSPLTYPLDPARMARTPVPLHEGAADYYREAGVIAAG